MMFEKTLCERILIFLMTYMVSILCIPIFGIFKLIFLIYISIQNIIKPLIVRNSYELHTQKIKYVQKQVIDWNINGRGKTLMCTGRPGWRSLSIRMPIYKNTMTQINVDMGDIIEIDPIKKVVHVEPLMSMGRLTSILIPMGWTIPVVPELNDLTIGGLICGAGIETSSHKYGLLHNICISFEIVLASGQVIKCSKEQNSDLFHAIPGSCGTIGFLTCAEIMIIPAQKYIKLEYIPVYSLDDAISKFEYHTNRESGNEFVEGIMYSLDKGVIMIGNMSNVIESGGKLNSIGRWYKPWFYKHVESILNKNNNIIKKYIEYIPLRQYYHRHTKSLFWEIQYVIPYGNNIIFRYLFGWILPFRVYILKLIVPDIIKKCFDSNHVTQDFVVPIEKLKESLILTHEEMQVYPIWLCPGKLINTPGALHFLGDKDEMYVDFGIYGMTKLKTYELIKSARILEMFCIKNRGYQALYSDICMTRNEFDQMFDNTHYLKVRTNLNCLDAFPDVYDKVCRAARR